MSTLLLLAPLTMSGEEFQGCGIRGGGRGWRTIAAEFFYNRQHSAPLRDTNNSATQVRPLRIGSERVGRISARVLPRQCATIITNSRQTGAAHPSNYPTSPRSTPSGGDATRGKDHAQMRVFVVRRTVSPRISDRMNNRRFCWK